MYSAENDILSYCDWRVVRVGVVSTRVTLTPGGAVAAVSSAILCDSNASCKRARRVLSLEASEIVRRCAEL